MDPRGGRARRLPWRVSLRSISRGQTLRLRWPASARRCRSNAGAGRRDGRRRGRSSPPFLSQPLPFLRWQIPEALPQLAPLLRSEALELAEVLADARLLAIGQLLELLIPMPDQAALLH